MGKKGGGRERERERVAIDVLCVHLSSSCSVFCQQNRGVPVKLFLNLFKGFTHLLPVSVLHAGVADGREEGQVGLELVHLDPEAVRHAPRSRQLGEALGEFVHEAPHGRQLLGDVLGVQVLEGA